MNLAVQNEEELEREGEKGLNSSEILCHIFMPWLNEKEEMPAAYFLRLLDILKRAGLVYY